MEIFIYLLIAALLILLNAFFVLAEFAAVKVRPTRMDELAAKGSRAARMVQHIQANLDSYLSVCQVGITLASIGIGLVVEPVCAQIFMPLLKWAGDMTAVTAHGLAVSCAYVLVSYLHIVIGEQVPKSVAIRRADAAALLVAYPLKVCHYLFLLPLWVLNGSVKLSLRLLRQPPPPKHEYHSEDEIRIILDRSQSSGLLSFRRLLYIENVLDFGALKVLNAMRPLSAVRCLKAGAPRTENERVIVENRHSRYPLLDDAAPGRPLGCIHVKELYLAERAGKDASDLRALVRPCLSAREEDPLEPLLSEMQRKGNHMALVHDAAGQWTGIVTMEDILEEIVGTVEEEFPVEPPVYLCDRLQQEHILLDVEGENIMDAVWHALERIPAKELPLPKEAVLPSIAEREKLVSSYVGRRIAIPHARLANLARTFVIVARLKEPIPAPVPGEDIHVLFILLTPANMPRIHQIMLSHIAGMLESGFLEERLHEGGTPAEVFDAIRTAEQTALA
jgi:CBS domain containing-hemolysin-like protein/mannitol/fructose-specific phosphotransferase system IIA component